MGYDINLSASSDLVLQVHFLSPIPRYSTYVCISLCILSYESDLIWTEVLNNLSKGDLRKVISEL